MSKRCGLISFVEQIKLTAYNLAKSDGFKEVPEFYWFKAKNIILTKHNVAVTMEHTT